MAGLFVIFLSGLLTGSVGTELYIRHAIRTKVNELVSGNNKVAAQLVMTRLEKSLALNTEQKKAIYPIVLATVIQVRTLRARMRPEFEKIFLQASHEIKIHLNKNQQKKLDKFVERIQKGLSMEKK